MPHAEETIVNGEKGSKTFNHITSYPLVSDTISTLKSHPYGARATDMASNGYNTLIAPAIPYAQRPYGYVKPYVERADALADGSLSRVDSRFPIVKDDTDKIRGTVMSYVYWPFNLAGRTGDYVLNTYGDEYRKCGGDGPVAGGKALVTTGLHVTSDTLSWVSDWLSARGKESKAYAHDRSQKAMHYASDKSQQATNFAYDKGQHARSFVGDKSQQAMNVADDKGQHARNFVGDKGQQAADVAGDKGQQARNFVDDKSSKATGTARDTYHQGEVEAKGKIDHAKKEVGY